MGDFGNCQVMAENLSYYMQKHNITRNELADIAGASYSAVVDWLKARKYPRIDKIERMANYFGVSKSALVEPHSETDLDELTEDLSYRIARVMSETDTFRKELLRSVLSLTDDQQHAIMSVAQAMKNGGNQK